MAESNTNNLLRLHVLKILNGTSVVKFSLTETLTCWQCEHSPNVSISNSLSLKKSSIQNIHGSMLLFSHSLKQDIQQERKYCLFSIT